MKRNYQSIESLLFFFSIFWFLVGFFVTSANKTLQWGMSAAINTPDEYKNIVLYGYDYKAYKFLNNTPKDSKILILAPRAYYILKSIFFLYPRELKIIKRTESINIDELKNYDYFFTFYSSDQVDGLMSASNHYAKDGWDENVLYEIHKLVMKTEDNFQLINYHNEITKNNGVILYDLNNI